MTNRKTTRRALVLSLLSLLLCCSMLVGTTFAWFTDAVQSGTNKIVAGNLDVEVYYGDPADKQSIKDVETLFNDVTLWEPGAVAFENLTVANEGTLALKYDLRVNFTGENTVEGYGLSQILKVGIAESSIAENATREQALDKVSEWLPMADFSRNGTLAGNTLDKTFAIVIYWEPSADDNNWNVNNGKTVSDYAETKKNELHIDLGIKLEATQLTSEVDSFGSDYDKGAAWTGALDLDWYFSDPDATEFVITSGEELAGLAALVNGTATAPATTYARTASAATVKDDFKGKTIKLGANIDLFDTAWTPIGDDANPFRGNFDGQGHTISNLKVTNSGWAGLIGHAGLSSAVTIKNVTIDGATIRSNRMAGAVAGQVYGSIDNCHVTDAIIIVTPNAVDGGYDNGDKVGGIVGWLGDNGNNRTLTNCSVKDVELSAYRDVGGIAGYVASSTTISGCSASKTTITVDQMTKNYGDKDPNAGAIFGRGENITDTNNTTSEDVSVLATYAKDGLILREGNAYNGVALYLVPETYEGTTLSVPEGVITIGNYAFAYNTNVETVTLPSTVRDLGRGFDSSTVKKVVLNEGLTTISSRAFRSTTALEEVVISSTVTEIADNAFQKSGIKEIVIPDSVKTIGETAFGASLIETVIFEGDIEIQGYAFRGCTKLRTVKMYGDDVKFVASTLNGRNSCWFCNGESNNPNTSNITFTVRSEEIKERVLTAMGAERNNTPVIVDDGFVG